VYAERQALASSGSNLTLLGAASGVCPPRTAREIAAAANFTSSEPPRVIRAARSALSANVGASSMLCASSRQTPGEKHLSSTQIQAILPSDAILLGECRMKKLSITVNGSSNIAFASFFKKDVSGSIAAKSDDDDFDLTDFISDNCDKSVFFGRGFSTDEEYSIQLKLEDEIIYDGEVFTYETPNTSLEEIKKTFFADNNVEFDSVLSTNSILNYDADQYFFGDAEIYRSCCLEIVNTLKANDTIEIEVEDDFAISALRIVMMQGDTGSNSSITQHIFRTSFLDAQVFGCVYKDIFYQFEGGFFEGFESEYHWFEKNGRKWSTV
jgi:hypothetical protein